MIPPLPNEAATLRAMLGIGPPVLLDIKPGPLTERERRRFESRLAELETTWQSPAPAIVSWWQRWRRIGRQTQ